MSIKNLRPEEKRATFLVETKKVSNVEIEKTVVKLQFVEMFLNS